MRSSYSASTWSTVPCLTADSRCVEDKVRSVMTSMVAQELVRAADAPQATRAELERERREVVAQLREAAESGDDAAARALCRRRDEIDGQIAADAELDALRAARSRKQARAAQREQLVAQKAEWLARAAELEPERARLAAAWQEVE